MINLFSRYKIVNNIEKNYYTIYLIYIQNIFFPIENIDTILPNMYKNTSTLLVQIITLFGISQYNIFLFLKQLFLFISLFIIKILFNKDIILKNWFLHSFHKFFNIFCHNFSIIIKTFLCFDISMFYASNISLKWKNE